MALTERVSQHIQTLSDSTGRSIAEIEEAWEQAYSQALDEKKPEYDRQFLPYTWFLMLGKLKIGAKEAKDIKANEGREDHSEVNKKIAERYFAEMNK